MSEVVRPDAVGVMVPYDPSSFSETDFREATDPLSPCPSCNHSRNQAPEGVAILSGEPNWIHDYCWKCGFRPGTNVAVSESELRKQFAAFKQFLESQAVFQHPTLQPPDPSQVESMQAEIQRLQAEIAASQKG